MRKLPPLVLFRIQDDLKLALKIGGYPLLHQVHIKAAEVGGSTLLGGRNAIE